MTKGGGKVGAAQQHVAKGKGKKKSMGGVLTTSGNNMQPAPQAPSVAGKEMMSSKTGITGKVDTVASADAKKLPSPAASKADADPPESDVEVDDTKQAKQNLGRESISSSHFDKHGERSGRGGGGRFIIKNLWDVCCNETESEVKELDTVLKRLGLPSINYSKTKAYEKTDYDYAPDIQQCKSKDFLDYYVFPQLLPGIQALIQFARVNRVFQCRFCTFNALDYIVEYLYNNNPRYPERLTNPVPIFEIPFAKAWLEKHPRKPPPRWMLMSSEEAAIIIQRVIRGYMVRCRPEVQEMRQFWKAYRKDMEEEKSLYQVGKSLPKSFIPASVTPVVIYSPYYEEYHGEFDESCESPTCVQYPLGETALSTSSSHHSDNCACCQAFRKFLDTQPEEILKSYQRPNSNENLSVNGENGGLGSAGIDIIFNNEEDEGMTTDTGEEEEGEKGERKGSGPSGGRPTQIQDGGMLAPVATSSKIKGQNKLQTTSNIPKSLNERKSKVDKKPSRRKHTNE